MFNASCIMYHVLCVLCHVLCAMNHMSHVMCNASHVICHVSSVPCHLSISSTVGDIVLLSSQYLPQWWTSCNCLANILTVWDIGNSCILESAKAGDS